MSAMDELLPSYRLMWEPGGPGQNVQRHASYEDFYHDEIHSFLPGTWVIAGHHYGKPTVTRVMDAVRKVWTERSVFHHNNYWTGEDTICTEWFSTNQVWNGKRCRNSGLTRHTLRDGQVIDWQEYTDSEYFEEVHAGWRDAVGPEIGRYLARYAQTGPPWYPDPAQNEWSLETSLSDGRDNAPPAMRDRLAAAIEWWQAPRQGTRTLFAEDLRVHFQGRLWPLGGDHRGHAGLERLFAVAARLWPEPAEIVKTEFWANENSVLVHWFTRNKLWTGQPCRASGWAVWQFRGDQVVDWRNYVNTSYYAEVLAGWRDVVGPELGSRLPNWPEPGSPRYPDPMAHE